MSRSVDFNDPTTAVWETNNLDDHVALMKRQVTRSLDDPETTRLARAIQAGEGTTVRAWNQTWKSVKRTGPFGEACCDIALVWNFCVLNVAYVKDPDDYDLFCTVRKTLEAKAGDCFPEGTLLLRDDYSLTPIEQVRPGDRIWGRDRWSTVENVWAKGDLTFDLVRLNNGSQVWLTPDHKVYVGICDRHRNRTDASAPCSCPLAERRIERVHVRDLAEDDVLVQPEQIALGQGALDPRRAYVEGLYVADGWRSHENDFQISGKDGHPKEAQKREVESICRDLGIATRWYTKYISVKDVDWAQRMARMGSHAPTKRLLSLDLDEAAAHATLRGVMADSGANTHGNGRTFTTTSRTLATQVRVLHRMLGVGCGSSYIENHGGLGKHPIYRLSTLLPRSDGKMTKLLRVKEIVREVGRGPAWDISTDDHYVYMPEHDVTVSNCDDSTILMGALLKALGFRDVRARVISVDGRRWAHVYTMVSENRSGGGKLIALDPTVKDAVPGWEFGKARKIRDFKL